MSKNEEGMVALTRGARRLLVLEMNERVERTERAERVERAERAERAENEDDADKTEKNEKTKKAGGVEGEDDAEKTEKTEKTKKTKKTEKIENEEDRPAASRTTPAPNQTEPVALMQHGGESPMYHELALRGSLRGMEEVTWKSRQGVDVYTLNARSVVQTLHPQIDHVLEVQLVEHALVATVGAWRVPAPNSASTLSAATLRHALNSVANLNVTSRKVNQAKRGPFFAAMNQLRSQKTHGIRQNSLEELARRSRANGGWIIQDGTWARIEASVVQSYDAIVAHVETRNEVPVDSANLTDATLERLGDMLRDLKVL